jgi:hypothetical protein
MEQPPPVTPRGRLKELITRADAFFDAASRVVSPDEEPEAIRWFEAKDHWFELPDELKQQAFALIDDIVAFGHDVAPLIRHSPLLTEVDIRETGHATKGMRAALRLRNFEHIGPDIVHDGDNAFVRAAYDTESYKEHPEQARRHFHRWSRSLDDRLALGARDYDIGSIASASSPKPASSGFTTSGYRPGTAFILMWIAGDRPELVDVHNTVKRCFERFEIVARRADEIEHDDVITARILDEIKTAEFLFADLTGERPSVYYEVGYAHALGRRVMMYRRHGTNIHFDLAAYNCPEYENLAELEDRLMKRLESVTGKKPR